MKPLIMLASSAALVAAGSAGTFAYQQQIASETDLAVCSGIYLAMQWIEPTVDETQERVGSPVTYYLDDARSIQRAMDRDFRRGESSGMVDLWNLLDSRYDSRGCDRSYYVRDKREVCEALQQFTSADKRLMNCPD